MVMECTFCYSGGYKFCPVLFFRFIGFSGSLKKVDNSKYIKKPVIYNHVTNMAWFYADIHKT